jgi:hypothetical protein
LTTRYWAPPKPGDIVHCRFPEDNFAEPGPKERPALVTKVETRAGIVDVEVAYGTSQGIGDVHAGELVVPKTDPDAGLQKDTKFDLCNIVNLPFNEDWFAPDPAGRFGNHPKRGKLNLDNMQNKKKLQAAVIEAQHAGKVPTRPKRVT